MDKLGDGEKAFETFLEGIGDTPINEIPTEMIKRGKRATEELLEKYGHLPVSNDVTFKDELRDAFPVFNDGLDTSFLLELLYYFPIDKTNIATGSYDQYLYDLEKTVINNYDAGNYQVSFFYAHLIFMSYTYYCIERVYSISPERTKDVFYPMNAYRGKDENGKKIGKPDLESYRSVYEFSTIPEKDIFKIFHIMGMPDDTIRDIGKYINKRDDFAHATGKGNLSVEELKSNIKSVQQYMEVLNKLFFPFVKEQYVQYMLEHINCDCDYVLESISDYIFDNGLSFNEITQLCNLGLRQVQDEKGLTKEQYLQIRKVHCAVIEYCIENYGIEAPDGLPGLRDMNYLYYRYMNRAEDYVENEIGITAYECVKDGGELPVYACPECGEEQLVYDADTHRYHCFACDENFTDENLAFCERCGSIMWRNDDVLICQNCIEDMAED